MIAILRISIALKYTKFGCKCEGERREKAGNRKQVRAPAGKALDPEAVHCFLLSAFCFLLSPLPPPLACSVRR
jgi:hypothetical protein